MDKRLFFALWPDDRQREMLRDTLGPLARQVEGRAVPRGNWHVTLAFIGDFPQEKIPALLGAASGVTVDPFRLRFGRLTFWQRPRIACLEAMSVPPGLDALVGELNSVLAEYGVQTETGNYRPHITAVRGARTFESLSLARPLELSWSGFELIESVPAPGGVQYRPLKQEVPGVS